MIAKPQLPPKTGYVEVEMNGIRQYAPTAETMRAEIAALECRQDRADIDFIAIMQGVTL